MPGSSHSWKVEMTDSTPLIVFVVPSSSCLPTAVEDLQTIFVPLSPSRTASPLFAVNLFFLPDVPFRNSNLPPLVTFFRQALSEYFPPSFATHRPISGSA